MTAEQQLEQWERTRNIDNPLSPWVQMYSYIQEGRKAAGKTSIRPSHESFTQLFRRPKIIAYSTGITLTVVLVVVWPGVMASLKVFSKPLFEGWVYLSQTWAFIVAAFIIIVPLVQEVWAVYDQIQINKKSDEIQIEQNGGVSNEAVDVKEANGTVVDDEEMRL